MELIVGKYSGFCNGVKYTVDKAKEALEKGITKSVASCTMYIELGRRLHLAMGSEKNLKLTYRTTSESNTRRRLSQGKPVPP